MVSASDDFPGRPDSAGLRPSAFPEHPYVIQVRNLRKEYVTGRGRLVLFDGLSFDLAQGEMLAIVGQSGAGKSTLLHMLGALDAPSEGDVYCASIQLRTLNSRQAAAFRNREVGYVWQFHYLLPEFTALENVAMPLLARGEPKAKAFRSAEQWLNEVELGDRVTHRAGELSGGEQQRVSLARALVTGPKVLLADEPTGDLDSRTAEMVFSLIERLHQTHCLTSVIVTHNMMLAQRCSRVLRLEKGRVDEVSPRTLQ
ncbi:ABC transporter ATP-binding protein [Acidipila sp. 4G-K13]|uniref:ABC transporter ATP-binding protein n=2 Tax=Paracidobacterium acidisoli TaxID=2303751 RepID=A0A372ITR7_9BACT|nr:ABC transporter ATP-binding protein [Paracidobacterium acidisoli]